MSSGGEVGLQQRDDKPGIVNSGLITTFGGSMEPGESIEDSVVRELEEELSIKMDKTSLRELGVFMKSALLDGEDCECHIYVVEGVNKSDLILSEGKEIVWVRSKDQLKELNMSRVARKAMEVHFDSLVN